MNTEMKLNIIEIQRFCMHDGPGLRTTVFLKGCPLRCAWCHNPETQQTHKELLFYARKCIDCGACASCLQGVHTFDGQHALARAACIACGACADACPTGALELCGGEYAIADVLRAVERDRDFYAEQGGVTLSGGEPFAQGEAVIALLRACKERGLSTVVETCGYADFGHISEAIAYTDLFLWDVKDTDEARHRHYTGASNRKILENLRAADAAGAKTRLRCILVNGVNTLEDHYASIARLALSLGGCEGVEWIPYHAYGGTKAVFVGGADNANAAWIPTEEQLAHATRFLRERGVRVCGA